MNRQGYIKIMKAVANLIIVIMTEAGRVPLESAKKVANAFLQVVIGSAGKE